MRPPLHTLTIWGAGVYSPRSYGAKFVFSLSVTLLLGQLYTATSRVNIDHARHRKPRRCVYALNLGGTGISPPDSFSYRSSFLFRSRSRSRSPTKIPRPRAPNKRRHILLHSLVVSLFWHLDIKIKFVFYYNKQEHQQNSTMLVPISIRIMHRRVFIKSARLCDVLCSQMDKFVTPSLFYRLTRLKSDLVDSRKWNKQLPGACTLPHSASIEIYSGKNRIAQFPCDSTAFLFHI